MIPDEGKIDAIIKNGMTLTFRGQTILVGNIYGDTKGRFPDGKQVGTSEVVEVKGNIVQTRNSTYLVEWMGGAASAEAKV